MKDKKAGHVGKRMFVAAIAALVAVVIAVFTTAAGAAKEEAHPLEADAKPILLGMDVSDLTKQGAAVPGTMEDSDIYGRISKKEGVLEKSADLCTLDPAAEWLYWFESLYKYSGRRQELYDRLNKQQLADDGVTAGEQEIVGYLNALFPEPEGVFCKIKDYMHGDWMVVAFRYAPVMDMDASRSILYDYEQAVNVRFTIWQHADGTYSYVPYSIMEGVPQTLRAFCNDGNAVLMPEQKQRSDPNANPESTDAP